MYDDSDDDVALFAGLRGGDEVAVAAFCRRYGALLEQMADRHLATPLRRRIGADDVAQSVCRTFVRRAAQGEFELPDGGGLWALLSAITLTKVREQTRFHLRQKRGLQNERHLDSVDSGGDAKHPEPAGRQIDPADAAEFADEFGRLVSAFDDEERQIIELKLQDFTQQEIAEKMGCSERTVRRFLQRVQQRLTRMLDDGEESNDE